ncbi:unnamed protein product [Psylliodes chrysocephalus]|uniref:Reverse transcriptase n=1 Tax=Psylliodes chrysocephalus TaxID=3402493 RepID=A0A9P0CH86_9CUCU|nr:unnamed protein product [Psylliodes chrysocephala]
MIAIQDQVIRTQYYAKHILKDRTVPDDLCRRCKRAKETIHHITTGCQSIVQADYKVRHDQVAKIIHQKIALNFLLTQENTLYYKYTPERVMENDIVVLYWDRTLLTDRTVQANRPDITLINKMEKWAFLIDVAVPHTNNLQDTHNTKINKYRELAVEIKEQWGLNKVTILPAVL